MAYTKKTWLNKILTYPNKLLLKNKTTNEIVEYEIQADLTNIEQEGTPTSAENFNNIENGIYENSNNISELSILLNNKIDKYTKLYSNVSGSNSTTTLLETSANFEEVGIKFCNKFGGENRYSYVRLKNGQRASLVTTRNGGSYIYLFSAEILLNGTSITWISNGYQIVNLSGNTIATDNTQYIVEVIGINRI